MSPEMILVVGVVGYVVFMVALGRWLFPKTKITVVPCEPS